VGDGAEGFREEGIAAPYVGVRMVVARRAAFLVEEAGIDERDVRERAGRTARRGA
jgi:hypothetical protein